MGCPAMAERPSVPASIVLTAIENSNEPQSEFECRGRLHGYVRLPVPFTGSHEIESRWVDPSGKVVAQGRNDLDFKTPHSTAYVWMNFPERGNSLTGSLDPELDQVLASFNGRWRVDVLWDSKPLISHRFSVRCP